MDEGLKQFFVTSDRANNSESTVFISTCSNRNAILLSIRFPIHFAPKADLYAYSTSSTPPARNNRA